MLLSEGDRIPADGLVLSCNDLSVDESLLTGESLPVSKVADAGHERSQPGGDGLPFVYSGTLVVRGRGTARVTATGRRTEMGRIGEALATVKAEEAPVVKASHRVVHGIAGIGLMICVAAVVGYGLTRGDWLQAVLVGVTIAMSLLPEEIPVVLTVFLALGAWRIARRNVLARRAAAIETLGATTVLCVDKTGTLTLNQMAVGVVSEGDRVLRVRSDDPASVLEPMRGVVEYGFLASEEDPFDPAERAIADLHRRVSGGLAGPEQGWSLVHEYPFTSKLAAMAHVWGPTAQGTYVVAAKGAPEAIASLCHLDEADSAPLGELVRELSEDGFRVLAVARGTLGAGPWPVELVDVPR